MAEEGSVRRAATVAASMVGGYSMEGMVVGEVVMAGMEVAMAKLMVAKGEGLGAKCPVHHSQQLRGTRHHRWRQCQ